MSNPTTLAAKLIPLAISTDDVTYKNLVCLKVANLNLDIPTSDEETQCGKLTSEGSKVCEFDFEIVVNTTPNATEISGPEIMGYWDARTPIYVRIQPGTGMNVKSYGKLYNVKSSVTGGVDLYKITGTFKNDGDPVIS